MQRACDPVVVKLGGSVITVKNKPMTVDKRRLEKAAETIARFYKEHSQSGLRMALVHGGGSFGHYMVEKLLDEKGVLGAHEVSLIQEAMLRLSLEVARVLVELGVPVTVHPAHTLCDRRECKLRRLLADTVNGLVPLTYGDAVYDDRGALIISGDDLAAWIAGALGAKCLIYVTDAPGVISRDGRVLTEYTGEEELAGIGVEGSDVTGGMARKLRRALEFAEEHPDAVVRIVDVDGLEAALSGGEAGTLVRPWRR